MEYIDLLKFEFEKYAWRWDFIDFWASPINAEENKLPEDKQERTGNSDYSSSSKQG